MLRFASSTLQLLGLQWKRGRLTGQIAGEIHTYARRNVVHDNEAIAATCKACARGFRVGHHEGNLGGAQRVKAIDHFAQLEDIGLTIVPNLWANCIGIEIRACAGAAWCVHNSSIGASCFVRCMDEFVLIWGGCTSATVTENMHWFVLE